MFIIEIYYPSSARCVFLILGEAFSPWLNVVLLLSRTIEAYLAVTKGTNRPRCIILDPIGFYTSWN